MGNKPWNKSPNTLHYVYYEKNGKVLKFIERGDQVDNRIKKLEWSGLKIVRVDKKRET